ncbi:MAG: tetratricopeptide repeat protein [Asgard group archaeon]|nr:tetratricopeptide repeat protein [Asgard group archaeon]
MDDSLSAVLQDVSKIKAEGQFELALNKIIDFEQSSNLRLQDQAVLQLEKAALYNDLGNYTEALKLSEDLINNSQKLENSLQMLDAILQKARALCQLDELGKSLAYIKLGERILDKLNGENVNEIFSRKATLAFEKGYIFEKEEDLKNALESYLQSLSLRRELKNQNKLIESNNAIARVYYQMGDVVRSLMIYQQSLSMLKEMNNNEAIADTLNSISKIYLWKGEYGPALENALQSLSLSEESNNKILISNSLDNISIVYNQLGELNRSLEYLNRSVSLREEIGNDMATAETLLILSEIFLIKGELTQASQYLNQAKDLIKDTKYFDKKSILLEILGLIFFHRGELTEAIDNLTQCLEIRQEKKNKKTIITTLFWLIIINIENNNIEQAQNYFKKIQKTIEKHNNLVNDIQYRLSSAIILKRSSNFAVLAKSRELLEEIANSDITDIHLKAIALYSFCEVLLKEMQLDNSKISDIRNLEFYIKKHENIANQLESNILHIENLWLKANLALLQQENQEANSFFEQANQISEEKGLGRIGLKITKAQEIISGTNKENTSLTEQQKNQIIKLNGDSAVVTSVVQIIDKKQVDIPVLQEEEPVLLIIVYEGGVTVFSKKFSQKEMIDEMFVGGFLTAIDAFMHQTFATGGSIERIQHQEYTLLLKGENPLLFCYVFKGHSFTAIQKLDQIVIELKKAPTIWNSLTNNFGEQLNQAEKQMISELADNIFIHKDE